MGYGRVIKVDFLDKDETVTDNTDTTSRFFMSSVQLCKGAGREGCTMSSFTILSHLHRGANN